jgi:carboxyl-terminal processing protease
VIVNGTTVKPSRGFPRGVFNFVKALSNIRISYNAFSMDHFRRSFLVTFALGVCITIGFAGGYLAHRLSTDAQTQFPILGEAYDLLSKRGIKPLPASPATEYGMIRGMVQAYGDPYTLFVEPAQHELESDALQGSFGGIGVRLSKDQAGNVIIFPFPESPAINEGIREGDRLLAVDDLQITPDISMDSIQAALRGPVGQIVQVTYSQLVNGEPRIARVRREEIALPSVTWHLDADRPQVGVIEINLIAASTPDEIDKALRDLRVRNAVAIILDLRNNYGGLLSAGVDIARLFLKDGIIMANQYRDEGVEEFYIDEPGPYSEIPLVVLVNENTASAAEIIAGAIKVHSRAKIVGVSTYGKDSIQLVFDLKDGSSLHVTAAHWWIPGLTPPISEGGLQPDVVIEPSPSSNDPDRQLQAAVKTLLEP